MKITILHRLKGVWWNAMDVYVVAKILNTKIAYSKTQRDYLLLNGHFTKGDVLSALHHRDFPFTATQITGIDNSTLPFPPNFEEPNEITLK